MRAEFYGFAKQNRRQCRRSKTPRLSRRLSQASGCLLVCFTRLWLHPQSFRVLRSSLPLPSGRGLGWGKSAQPTTIHYSFFTFHYSLKCGLLPPLKGEVPRRGGGVASPSKAAGGGGGVYRTLRCEPFQYTFAALTVLERGRRNQSVSRILC